MSHILPGTILWFTLGGGIMIYFPNTDEEIALIKFIGKYQYITMSDTKYFFNTSQYYKKRITNLIKNKYIRHIRNSRSYLVLSKNGIQYLKSINETYNRLNRNEEYLPRLLFLSHFAAYYHNSSTISFIPSFDIKNHEYLTITSRRYIGLLNVNGTSYLAYRITKNNDNKYIGSVVYDIEKEEHYRNFIIFVDDISQIKLEDFTFGYNQVLIVEDNEENRDRLKYLNSVNWSNLINKEYKFPVLSEFNYCDYIDIKNKFISFFYFLDTEKINRILLFMRESKEKKVEVVCTKELKEKLHYLIPNAKYNVQNLDKFIDRKRIVYYE